MADRPLGRIAFLLFLFAAIETALGQGVLTYKKRDPSQIPVAVQLKRSVVQIELTCKQGQADSHFGGTGFLVSYPDPKLPPNSMFQYLVTNRHVAECWNEKHQPQTVTSLAIRANTSDGRAKLISKNPSDWRFLSDPSIDLAAMPILMPSEIQAVSFPINSFATRDYLSTNVIAEGSPIIVAGYFYQFPGEKKSEAIVRQGILSMMPDEPMMTTTGKPGNVYLGDVHIFGGNSGSPVLVAGDVLAMDGYRLVGIVSGYYFEDSDFNLEISTTVHGTSHGNSGIAMIVPVDYLKALLDDPPLKAPRDAYLSQIPTPSLANQK